MFSGIYRSAHKYKDAENPDADQTFVTRVHPLVRTHPVTGWKSLFGKSFRALSTKQVQMG